MKRTGLRIEGLGTAVPRHSLPQEVSAHWAQEVSGRNGRRSLIPALFKRTGVQRRHSVVLEGDPLRQTFFPPARDLADGGPTTRERMERFGRESRPLALGAARAALADATVATDGRAEAVSHLVTVSCSGFEAPGFDIALIRELGLPVDTQRTHVGFMGCHGALNGLRVARAYAEADPTARVLLCAVELCSLHYDYGHAPDKVVANALFADGAAAVVATGAGRVPDDGSDGPWRLVASGSCLLPDSEDLMTWSIGDHGFDMGLSPRVPDVIKLHLRPWLEEWLGRQGLASAMVGSWAVHPGGPRIVRAVGAALGLDPGHMQDSRAVLERYGNMSSPTVLFILERLRCRRAPRPCVALGFGPGLTVEAALFR